MTIFEEEIQAQGSVFEALTTTYWSSLDTEHKALRRVSEKRQLVVFTGMGSSLSAVDYALPLLRRAGYPAIAVDASELRDDGWPPILDGAAVIAISQSGKSKEIVGLIKDARVIRQFDLFGVVNDPESPLAELADHMFPMLAGPEKASSSKSFTASQIVMGQIAATLVDDDAQAGDMTQLATAVGGLIADQSVTEAAITLRTAPSLLIIARGPAISTAKYGALLVKESAAVHAEAASIGDFLHGPIELTRVPVGIVLLSLETAHFEVDTDLVNRFVEEQVPIWMITTAGNRPSVDERAVVTHLPILDDPMIPIAASVLMQTFTAAFSRLCGREPGVFTAFSRADTEVSPQLLSNTHATHPTATDGSTQRTEKEAEHGTD